MKIEDELNRNDIVVCYYREAGYYIVVNPDAGEDDFGRPLVTIRKIMTGKLLKRIGKNTHDVLKVYVILKTRKEMLELVEKGRKRFNDAEELIRGYQV